MKEKYSIEYTKKDHGIKSMILKSLVRKYNEYIKLDRDKSTFKSHRDFSSEIEITFKHF